MNADDGFLAQLRAENARLIAEIDRLRAAGSPELIDVGYYSYTHRLDTAAEYKDRLDDLQTRIKTAIKDGNAISAAEGFIYNNSLAKGKKMVADLKKLMLRAFNAEAENCIRTVRANNLEATVNRLERAMTSIARSGAMMEMHITDTFFQLRVDELRLTVDHLMKLQEEREAERERRAELREQRRVEIELAAERERLEKQRAHYVNVLAALGSDSIDRSDIESKIIEVDKAIENNDYRSANIRAGYVYVISNLGAFGPDIVKIGMTRRLDPMDRVRELGDASVPFAFDVHALFFSDDAVGVEAELHQRFAEKRVNRINLRREFFNVTPSEVKVELERITGSLLEYSEDAPAEQYRLSQSSTAAP